MPLSVLGVLIALRLFRGREPGSINVMAEVILIAPAAVAAILLEIDQSGIVSMEVLRAPMIARS